MRHASSLDDWRGSLRTKEVQETCGAAAQILKYRSSLVSPSRARQLSRDAAADGHFLCDKAAVHGNTIKDTRIIPALGTEENHNGSTYELLLHLTFCTGLSLIGGFLFDPEFDCEQIRKTYSSQNKSELTESPCSILHRNVQFVGLNHTYSKHPGQGGVWQRSEVNLSSLLPRMPLKIHTSDFPCLPSRTCWPDSKWDEAVYWIICTVVTMLYRLLRLSGDEIDAGTIRHNELKHCNWNSKYWKWMWGEGAFQSTLKNDVCENEFANMHYENLFYNMCPSFPLAFTLIQSIYFRLKGIFIPWLKILSHMTHVQLINLTPTQ